MFRKLALGLVAAASLGAAVLAPTAASAHFKGCCALGGGGFGGGWGFHHHHFGHGFGIGFIGGGDGCYVTREVMTPFGPRLRTVNVCY